MSEHHVTVIQIGALERHPNADTLIPIAAEQELREAVRDLGGRIR